MKRLAVSILALTLLGASAPLFPVMAVSPALQVVGAIAKYVGLTAAFAESLNTLARAVVQVYAAGHSLVDDIACRAQKKALQELVLALSELEREKEILNANLRHVVSFPHAGGWRRIHTQAGRVRMEIQDVEQTINTNRGAFRANLALQDAYTSLLISFDDKRRIVRDLVAEMDQVDWEPSRVEARRFMPHLHALSGLQKQLATEIGSISRATDSIADYAHTLCERPLTGAGT